MFTLPELQKQDRKTLAAELLKAREEWLKIRLSVVMNQDKRSHVLHKNKVYISQILTVLQGAKA